MGNADRSLCKARRASIVIPTRRICPDYKSNIYIFFFFLLAGTFWEMMIKKKKKRTLGSLISFINQMKTEYCPEISIGSRGARPSGLLISRGPSVGGSTGPPQSVKTYCFFISATSTLNARLRYYSTSVDLSDTTELLWYDLYATYSTDDCVCNRRWTDGHSKNYYVRDFCDIAPIFCV